ncbi:uncharacterized protein N7529_003781 [Penicillium soppii]|uniref:uncharacterized protein n=1 Tax=Penicillium soppii TaxID=69789 RepID=UPI0025491773|nr:uncharacterized protein N7529_003781 [Penicillium soppii]KAJ5871428.1 hypothetical protein N7529_003781 [Penicillium soppii]
MSYTREHKPESEEVTLSQLKTSSNRIDMVQIANSKTLISYSWAGRENSKIMVKGVNVVSR